jgi:hypothetical protein
MPVSEGHIPLIPELGCSRQICLRLEFQLSVDPTARFINSIRGKGMH